MSQIIYCYDAYCSWCFGFSRTITAIADKYKHVLAFEVLSGGMIVADPPQHISVMAQYIADSYKQVEGYAGVKFGSDYLWHVLNPDESDWFPDSRKPAIALCIFKEHYPELQVLFAAELQKALFEEGRDLCDNEAYRHLLELYHIDADDFFAKLGSEEYAEKAAYEFALVRQLQVTGFPVVLYQASETKFHLVARGYTDFETVDLHLQKILEEESGR
jgi:putative protein-disulfide isomerase